MGCCGGKKETKGEPVTEDGGSGAGAGAEPFGSGGGDSPKVEDEKPALPAAGDVSPELLSTCATAWRTGRQRHEGKNPALKDIVRKIEEDDITALLAGTMSKSDLIAEKQMSKRVMGDDVQAVLSYFFKRLFKLANVEAQSDLNDVIDDFVAGGGGEDHPPSPKAVRDAGAVSPGGAASPLQNGAAAAAAAAPPRAPRPPRPPDTAEVLQLARGWESWQPTYVAGAEGTDKDVLLSPDLPGVPESRRNLHWKFDGRNFTLSVEDQKRQYSIPSGIAEYAQARDWATGKDKPKAKDKNSGWGKPVYERPEKDMKKHEVWKGHCQSWTRESEIAEVPYCQVRVFAEFPGIEPQALSDILQDATYRGTWDFAMVKGRKILDIGPTNDIGYYQASLPLPLFDNREFVNQRCWRNFGDGEFMIINHSVDHNEEPKKEGVPDGQAGDSARKGCTRAWSHKTVYYMKRRPDIKGAELHYSSHSSPGGSMPSILVNHLTGRLAPGQMEKMAGASKEYKSWLGKNWKASPNKELKGPWDEKTEKEGKSQPYFPRHPERPADQPARWDGRVLPWDWEEKLPAPLIKEQEGHRRKLTSDERRQRQWLVEERKQERVDIDHVAKAAATAAATTVTGVPVNGAAEAAMPPPPAPPEEEEGEFPPPPSADASPAREASPEEDSCPPTESVDVATMQTDDAEPSESTAESDFDDADAASPGSGDARSPGGEFSESASDASPPRQSAGARRRQ